jgi:hypothetical protein
MVFSCREFSFDKNRISSRKQKIREDETARKCLMKFLRKCAYFCYLLLSAKIKKVFAFQFRALASHHQTGYSFVLTLNGFITPIEFTITFIMQQTSVLAGQPS